jgi:O-antigen biosynthesis protein
MTHRETEMPAIAEAIRWIGPTRITGEVHDALLCHPDSSVTWNVPVPARARVVSAVALLPAVWTRNSGGVQFRIDVERSDGTTLATAERHVDPRRHARHWQWIPLSVDLANGSAMDARITLRTVTPPGASAAYAWAVWGDPRVERDRSVRESLRQARAALAHHGPLGLLRRARQLGSDDTADAQYQRWIAAHTRDAAALAALGTEIATLPLQPLISIVTPVFNTDPKWLRACIDSVRRQVYPRWELCIADDASTKAATLAVLDELADDARIKVVRRSVNGHISAASNDALALATGDYVAFLDHDDELAPDALAEVVRALNANPAPELLYSDEDKLSVEGARCDPFFKPGWSPEHFLGQMYTCHLTVARVSLVRAVGGFREGYEGAQDYDLWLRMIARKPRIAHVPRMLYHWRKIPGSAAAEAAAKPYALANARRAIDEYMRAIGVEATVTEGRAPSLWRVSPAIKNTPPVTIVIPTAGRSAEVGGKTVDLLAHAVRSIAQKTTWRNYQMLIVDNGDLREETRAAIAAIPHRRVTYDMPPGPFNFSRKLNFAMRHAETDYLVILNDDIEVITPAWIEGLLEHAQNPEVGAVGCRLLYPDGRLQHVGVVTGVCGIAAHLHHQASGDHAGWNAGAITTRNFSVVTGAVMMTRRDAWDKVGGFDERMRIDFNDVDYCLKLREAGYRMVYTPFVECYHHESGSFGARAQNPDDVAAMRAIWGETLERDPFYNPNLTREYPDCRLP